MLRRVAAIAMTLLLASPAAALAYVGPGAGFALLGTGYAVLALAALVIVGFVWYPASLLWRAIARRAHESRDSRP